MTHIVSRTHRGSFPIALQAGFLGASLLACAKAPEPLESHASPTATQVFTYHEPGPSTGRVERVIDARGGEALRGRTELRRPAWSTDVVEDVTLDPAGQLVEAVIATKDGAGTSLRVTLDRPGESVRIEGQGGAVSFRVPADAPWIYGPGVDGTRDLPSTPVAGWIGHRAAQSAPFVRTIDVARRTSYRVPSDQVAFPGDGETTIALGSDAFDVSRGFVQEARLTDLGIRLTRMDHLFSASDPARRGRAE
jgi:hypothetical protein